MFAGVFGFLPMKWRMTCCIPAYKSNHLVNKKEESKLDKIREQIDILEKQEIYYLDKINSFNATARRCATSDPHNSKLAIMKRIQYERKLPSTQANLKKLQDTLDAIHTSKSNKDVLDAMRIGVQEMQEMSSSNDVSSARDLIAELQGTKISIDELSTALIGNDSTSLDSIDVEEEYNKLLAEEKGDPILNNNNDNSIISTMPDIPSSNLTYVYTVPSTQEKHELGMLLEGMGF